MLTATAFSVRGSVRRLSDIALRCALGLVLRLSAMHLIHHSLDGRAMFSELAERYLEMATVLKNAQTTRLLQLLLCTSVAHDNRCFQQAKHHEDLPRLVPDLVPHGARECALPSARHDDK